MRVSFSLTMVSVWFIVRFAEKNIEESSSIGNLLNRNLFEKKISMGTRIFLYFSFLFSCSLLLFEINDTMCAHMLLFAVILCYYMLLFCEFRTEMEVCAIIIKSNNSL